VAPIYNNSATFAGEKNIAVVNTVHIFDRRGSVLCWLTFVPEWLFFSTSTGIPNQIIHIRSTAACPRYAEEAERWATERRRLEDRTTMLVSAATERCG